jgi:hypothetical protein
VAFYPRVKCPECRAHHSPPPSAEVKNDGAIPPFPLCLHHALLTMWFTFLYTRIKSIASAAQGRGGGVRAVMAPESRIIASGLPSRCLFLWQFYVSSLIYFWTCHRVCLVTERAV